tara:strand:- start:127 stop:366 length:240 start_codon:yes stop_codon:yes gene_type:complete
MIELAHPVVDPRSGKQLQARLCPLEAILARTLHRLAVVCRNQEQAAGQPQAQPPAKGAAIFSPCKRFCMLLCRKAFSGD